MWWAIAVSSASGILGTGLGAAASCLLKRPSSRLLSRLISLTAGMMTAVACFDLMPEAFEMAGYPWALCGFLIGVALVALLARWVRLKPGRSSLMATGIIVAMGIAAHNLPEGLAIGAGFAGSPALGLTVGLVIASHDFPEGVAMGVPLSAGGMKAGKVVLMAALSGVPTGVGGMIGFLTGSISPQAIGVCMGVAGGSMLSIVTADMLPEAGELGQGKPSVFSFAAGVAIGIAAIAFLRH